MRDFFLNFFKVTGEADQRRIVLATSAVSTFISAAFFTLSIVTVSELPLVASTGIVFSINLVTMILAYRSILRPAQLLIPLAVLGAITLKVYDGYGLHDVSILGFVIVIVLASLLLGSTGAVAFGILSLIATILIGVGEISGTIQNDFSSHTGIDSIVIVGLFIVIGTLVQRLLIARLNKSLKIARANEQAQAQANQELRVLQSGLEQRVEERTQELNRRTAQLEAAGFVSRRAAEISDLALLLDEAVRLISEQFNFYHAGIFLADADERFMVLQAASSMGGKQMLRNGHRLAIGRQGLVGNVAYTKRSRIALDFGAEADFFNNPDLPEARSEMALPLIVRNQLVGVLDIQSAESNAFTASDASTLQTMADQIALAIENARLLMESQSALKQIAASSAESTYTVWKEELGARPNVYEYTPLEQKSYRAEKAEQQPAGKDSAIGTLIVPLTLRGQSIGNIVLTRKGSNANWSDEDREIANAVAAQLGVAMENVRLLEESQQRAAREQIVSELTTTFTRSVDVETLLQTAVTEISKVLNLSTARIELKMDAA